MFISIFMIQILLSINTLLVYEKYISDKYKNQ
jgi:hypothetical protein